MNHLVDIFDKKTYIKSHFFKVEITFLIRRTTDKKISPIGA